jgi:ribosomal protein S18 acetylase RimI-like enzyme
MKVTNGKFAMTDKLSIRAYRREDKPKVIDLWFKCNLVISDNNPDRDIERKLDVNPELFLVGFSNKTLVATCMAGYEGHRGWINYLAVAPEYRRRGLATRMMDAAEKRLRSSGCPKINLQVRTSNKAVIQFYESIGYTIDGVISLGKRLVADPAYEHTSDD